MQPSKILPVLSGFILATLCTSFSTTASLSQEGSPVLPVKDAFSILGYGLMVTGKIESGISKPGIKLEARGRGDKVYTLTVGKIYINNKEVSQAVKDDEVTLQAKGVTGSEVSMGMILSAPGSFQTVQLAEASVSFPVISGDNPVKDRLSVQVLLHGNTEFATLLLKDGI